MRLHLEGSTALARFRPAILVAAAFFSVAVVIWTHKDVIGSESADLALHYALIKQLADFGTREGSESELADMSDPGYPDLSHWVVALIGRRFGVVKTLSLTTVVCLLTVYFCLSLMAVRRSVLSTASTLILFAGFIRAFAFLRVVCGYEIIGVNFFFSHLFSDALAFSSALAIFSLTSPGSKSRPLLVFGAMWIIAAAHILPAVFLFGSFSILTLIEAEPWTDCWRLPDIAMSSAIRSLLPYAGVACAFVLLHPAFLFVKHMALVDGNLKIRPAVSVPLVLVFVALLGATVSGKIRFPRNEGGRFDPLILAMAITSILLLVIQCCAWELFGAGSYYAIKKHFFHIFTIAALILAIQLAPAAQGAAQGVRYRARWLVGGVSALDSIALCLIASSVVVASLYSSVSYFDFARLARLQSVALKLRSPGNLVIPADSALTGAANEMVYLGDLHQARFRRVDFRLAVGATKSILEDAAAKIIHIDYVVTDDPDRFREFAGELPSTVFVTYSDAPPGYVILGPLRPALPLR